MPLNIFDEILNKQTLFRTESSLDINFIPEDLPHREKELSLLSQLFTSLILQPNSISRRVLITGGTGIGKTVTVKKFGKMITDTSKRRGINIKYIHINCRKERTSYKVLINIVRQLKNNFPKRGFSSQDLLETILNITELNDYHILLVLDELNYLIDKDGDFIYSLTRLYDDSYDNTQRLSIIGIVKDISCLNNLDNSTLSTLQNNIIKFKNYSIDQIYDILKYRVILSVKENTFSDHLVKLLAEIVYEKGDIRYGLNLIWKSCKIAENKNINYVSAEILRIANQDLVPYSIHDYLKYMDFSKLLFLLSIIFSLKNRNKEKISMGDIFSQYNVLCENIEYEAKSYSQLWNYMKEFQQEGIVLLNITSKEIKGRKAFIEIPNISVLKLETIIINSLKKKGIEI